MMVLDMMKVECFPRLSKEGSNNVGYDVVQYRDFIKGSMVDAMEHQYKCCRLWDKNYNVDDEMDI